MCADIDGACLKGSKQFQGETCFVGNGVAKVSRDELFKNEKPSTDGTDDSEGFFKNHKGFTSRKFHFFKLLEKYKIILDYSNYVPVEKHFFRPEVFEHT